MGVVRTKTQKIQEHEKENELREFLIRNLGHEIMVCGYVDADPAWRWNGKFFEYTVCLKRIEATLPRGNNFSTMKAGTHLWFSLKDFPFLHGYSISPEIQKLENTKGHKVWLLGVPYRYLHTNNDDGVGLKVKRVLGVLPLE